MCNGMRTNYCREYYEINKYVKNERRIIDEYIYIFTYDIYAHHR